MNATKSAIQTRIEPCESWGKYVLEIRHGDGMGKFTITMLCGFVCPKCRESTLTLHGGYCLKCRTKLDRRRKPATPPTENAK